MAFIIDYENIHSSKKFLLKDNIRIIWTAGPQSKKKQIMYRFIFSFSIFYRQNCFDNQCGDIISLYMYI